MSLPVICQVLHTLTVGGAEVLAVRLAQRLAERYRFVFACLDDLGPLGQQLREEGFTVEILNRRPGLDVRCVRRLARLWRTHRVGLVHAHQYTPFFYALAARGPLRRPPVLFTEHGRWFPDYPRTKRIVFNRLFLRRTDRVVAVGQSVRQALIDNEGIPEGRIQVIYNGIEPSQFDRPMSDRATLRQRLDLDPSDFVVIQVARLDYLKDHDTALRMVQRVSRSLPRVRLLVVGEGPKREEIVSGIERYDLGNQVRLLGLRRDIAELLQAADVFCLTSISEGIPVTLLEAMAAGLPVVATAVGGVPEVVVDGETGLLAPAGDDAALAEALCRLAQDAELRTRLGRAGTDRVRRVFSENQMHAGYQALYDELLGG